MAEKIIAGRTMSSRLRFLFHYIWKQGFRDGYRGLVFCRLLAWYEWMIRLKESEKKRTQEIKRSGEASGRANVPRSAKRCGPTDAPGSYRRFLRKARPDDDFRYRSNCTTRDRSKNPT